MNINNTGQFSKYDISPFCAHYVGDTIFYRIDLLRADSHQPLMTVRTGFWSSENKKMATLSWLLTGHSLAVIPMIWTSGYIGTNQYSFMLLILWMNWQADTSRVVWSWHSSDPSSVDNILGHQFRGTTSVNLLGGLNDPPPEPDDKDSFIIAQNNVSTSMLL